MCSGPYKGNKVKTDLLLEASREPGLAGSLLCELLEMVTNPVHQIPTLAKDLTAVGIEYAVIGGMALKPHNYDRYTGDIDILISKETYPNIKNLYGRGYTLRPGATKNLYMHVGGRHIEIDVLVEGQKEGNVLMPDPTQIRQMIGGVWYASLPQLVGLKLLAGREEDIRDVGILIRNNRLTQEYSKNIPANVQQQFLKLFQNFDT